eukprot:scaffold40362_cov52-Attheya_sp.AAC.1
MSSNYVDPTLQVIRTPPRRVKVKNISISKKIIGGTGVLCFLIFVYHQTDPGVSTVSTDRENGVRVVQKVETRNSDCLSSITQMRQIKLYSQNDEDGALLQALRCTGGHGTKEYFEFGSQTGVEVNTRILREHFGWKGHLLDGGNENPSISLHKEWFTPSNIVSLLQKYSASKTLDVLSIDCDYDDFFVLREILLAGYRPRVLIIEYNRNFHWDTMAVTTVAKTIGQEGSITAMGDCYFGASASAMTMLADAFRYALVFSNGVNLVFIDRDIAKKLSLILPDAASITPPIEYKIHQPCPGREWGLVDSSIIGVVTDPSVSHVILNETMSKVKLNLVESKQYRFFEPEPEK